MRHKLISRLGSGALVLSGALIFLLLTVPLVVLTGQAVVSHGWEGLPQAGVTEAVVLSIVTTFITALLTLLLGTPLAYMLARRRFRFKSVVSLAIELPIVLPPAVAGLALLVTFGRRGAFGPALALVGIQLPFTTAAIVMAQTFVSAPFFIRAAQVGFENVPGELEDAARVDGASGLRLFRSITLPLAARALAAGLALSWARALGEFGATILFAGNIQGKRQTMPLLVYNLFESDVNAAVWAGVLMIGMALTALIISRLLTPRAEVDDP